MAYGSSSLSERTVKSSLSFCRCFCKGSTFSSVIYRPGFEPAVSRSADRPFTQYNSAYNWAAVHVGWQSLNNFVTDSRDLQIE